VDRESGEPWCLLEERKIRSRQQTKKENPPFWEKKNACAHRRKASTSEKGKIGKTPERRARKLNELNEGKRRGVYFADDGERRGSLRKREKPQARRGN